MASSLSAEAIMKSESFPGIKAGTARLEDILNGPSYRAVSQERWPVTPPSGEMAVDEWPPDAASVLVLGLHHPKDTPGLDRWDGGNTPGNRQLMEISDFLKQWFEEEHGIHASPLPYHTERGGLFLKDAAVLSGLGVIGRNNLLLNPNWGPRIRLRAILIGEKKLEPSRPVEGFTPCDACGDICHNACPQNAFSTGLYHRPSCIRQMDADRAESMPDEKNGETLFQYCRACEFVCPAGA